MHKVQDFLTQLSRSARMIWKACIAAALVGAACGVSGSWLFSLVNWCSADFDHRLWLVWLLPAGGLVIAFVYGKAKDVTGTNEVLEAVRGKRSLSALMVPLICFSTVVTRFFGGSVGTEGAAIQLGGGLASGIGKLFRLGPEQTKVVIMSGISGGFAAVVGTPVTAIVLAIEIAGVGIMYYAAILPCAVASAVSFAIAQAFGSNFPKFAMHTVPDLAALPIVQVIGLALLCGLVSILVCVALRQTGRFFGWAFPNLMVRAVVGGLLIALLTWAVGTSRYNGGGLDLVQSAEQGHTGPFEFLVKLAFTAVTLGAGFRGGAIVPTLVTGAAFGGFMGPAMGLSPSLGTGIGMTAVFCGAINCPMTSFVLGLEVFGLDASLYFLLACAVSYVVSGYFSIYPAQKIWLSKVGARPVNRNGI